MLSLSSPIFQPFKPLITAIQKRFASEPLLPPGVQQYFVIKIQKKTLHGQNGPEEIVCAGDECVRMPHANVPIDQVMIYRDKRTAALMAQGQSVVPVYTQEPIAHFDKPSVSGIEVPRNLLTYEPPKQEPARQEPQSQGQDEDRPRRNSFNPVANSSHKNESLLRMLWRHKKPTAIGAIALGLGAYKFFSKHNPLDVLMYGVSYSLELLAFRKMYNANKKLFTALALSNIGTTYYMGYILDPIEILIVSTLVTATYKGASLGAKAIQKKFKKELGKGVDDAAELQRQAANDPRLSELLEGSVPERQTGTALSPLQIEEDPAPPIQSMPMPMAELPAPPALKSGPGITNRRRRNATV